VSFGNADPPRLPTRRDYAGRGEPIGPGPAAAIPPGGPIRSTIPGGSELRPMVASNRAREAAFAIAGPEGRLISVRS